jgi:hypothetical protein
MTNVEANMVEVTYERIEDLGPPSDIELEMGRLLDLIDAEWRSDPTSVACFDLRIVEQVRAVLLKHSERKAYALKILRRFKSGRY